MTMPLWIPLAFRALAATTWLMMASFAPLRRCNIARTRVRTDSVWQLCKGNDLRVDLDALFAVKN